jgi:hypothetical protein
VVRAVVASPFEDAFCDPAKSLAHGCAVPAELCAVEESHGGRPPTRFGLGRAVSLRLEEPRGMSGQGGAAGLGVGALQTHGC